MKKEAQKIAEAHRAEAHYSGCEKKLFISHPEKDKAQAAKHAIIAKFPLMDVYIN